MIENVIFEFYRGDTYTRDFSIKPSNLSIEEIFFTVKEKEDDKRALIQKKINDGITLADVDEEKKTYNLLIDADDTDDFRISDYPFDIEIIMPTSTTKKKKKTIIKGIMRLKNDITTNHNERGAN